MNAANEAVAASHIRLIKGPTILMGDGSYFDYCAPEASTMTVEDVAFALAYTVRFRGQCRARAAGGRRVFYSVAEHCVRGARQMLLDGYGVSHSYAFLMHELGEVPWGDMPGPAKPLVPEFKRLEKMTQAALEIRFGAGAPDPDLIKRYDLRMLATEKRDLMPQSGGDEWGNAEDCADLGDYAPFPWTIVPYSHPDIAALEFLSLCEEIG